MPLRSTLSSRPTEVAASADFCSDEAIGSLVNLRFFQAAAMTVVAEALLGDLLDLVVGRLLRLRRVGVDVLVGLVLTLEQLLHHVGVGVEELLGDDQVGRHELAVGPQVALVDQHLAAAFLDQSGGPRLRHPGPDDVAGLERVERLGVVLRHDRDVAAAVLVGLEALFLQPRAQGDVLGVAELGRGDLLALEVGRALDVRLDDRRTPRRRSRPRRCGATRPSTSRTS